MDWRWDFTFEVVLPRMWEAAGVTAYATVVSFLLALVFGLVLMLLKTSSSRWISWPAGELIEFIRATPLLVQIFFLFFVLPEIRPHLAAPDHRYHCDRYLQFSALRGGLPGGHSGGATGAMGSGDRPQSQHFSNASRTSSFHNRCHRSYQLSATISLPFSRKHHFLSFVAVV